MPESVGGAFPAAAWQAIHWKSALPADWLPITSHHIVLASAAQSGHAAVPVYVVLFPAGQPLPLPVPVQHSVPECPLAADESAVPVLCESVAAVQWSCGVGSSVPDRSSAWFAVPVPAAAIEPLVSDKLFLLLSIAVSAVYIAATAPVVLQSAAVDSNMPAPALPPQSDGWSAVPEQLLVPQTRFPAAVWLLAAVLVGQSNLPAPAPILPLQLRAAVVTLPLVLTAAFVAAAVLKAVVAAAGTASLQFPHGQPPIIVLHARGATDFAMFAPVPAAFEQQLSAGGIALHLPAPVPVTAEWSAVRQAVHSFGSGFRLFSGKNHL